MKHLIACLFAAALLGQTPALAQQESAADYPSRAVKIVVPFSPGGGSDFIARTVGKALSEKWGKPVIIENRTGAGSTLGASYALKSPPDGYTLLLVSSSYAVNPAVYANMTFDSLNDMTPVIDVAQNPDHHHGERVVPCKDSQRVHRLRQGQSGQADLCLERHRGLVHLNTEAFMLETGTKMVHVPYRGSGPSAMALLANEVQLFVGDAGSTSPHILAGTLRGLAVSNKERFALLPDIPTLSEAGFTAFDMPIWQGLLAPKGTPPAIVQKINADINAMLQTDEMKKAISQQLFVAVGGTPESFYDLIKSDMERWKKVVKAANIAPQQ
ncbi:MAG: tripartite tricarboxylate transporter substrate-binding protein [Pseudolabrys sp.]